MSKKYLIILFSLFFSQESINFNFESKYGNGTNINDNTGEEIPYGYFENLFDVNFNYNNLFFYTQLEYSNSPIYGTDRIKINDLPNTYFLEYSGSNLVARYGHLNTLFGYGLTANMFQDQSTDFDNRVKGWELRYSPIKNLDIFFVSGNGKYGAKSSGSLRTNDLLFRHSIDSYGAQFYTSLGDISLYSTDKTTYYSSGIYNSLINSDTRLSVDFQDYFIDNFGEVWDSLSAMDTEVNFKSFNIGYSKTLGNFDIYFENEINTYNKIFRGNEDGYQRYLSIATDILDVNFLYEFKDYNMIYYMPISSNPPLGFSESTSVLVSRNQHNINFSDEIGHQFESRFNIMSIYFLMNASVGMRHPGVRNLDDFSFDDDFNITYGTHEEPHFSDFLVMDFLDEAFRAHKPFRDVYIEGSGWNSRNNFYYKLGYHSHYSYDDASGKNYQSYTIPTQFVYSFKNNNSLTLYYEYQNTDNLFSTSDFVNGEMILSYDTDNYQYSYTSISYHINNFGAISYFYDHEEKIYSNGITHQDSWTGVDLTLELSSTMQLSIFKGSQKGGLVCANGICAVQPSFEDGVKITFRALF